MKTEEESLSNYRIEANQNDSSQAKYPEDKVKEAVKKLKEVLENDDGLSSAHYNNLMNKIDKIFGDKLVK